MTSFAEPLVSVIVPAYQADRFLSEALESVRTQTYRHIEIIVVDDGSTDRTRAVARTLPGVRLLELSTNQGVAAARNAGVEVAGGELITFLDADDLMKPDRISVQVRHLADHPDCGCVLGRQEVFAESGVAPPDGGFALVDRAGDPLVQSMTAMVRAAVFIELGGFDPSFRVGSDMDWLMRLHASGLQIDTLDDVLVRRRFHGANLTYATTEQQDSLLRAVRSRLTARRSTG